MRIRYILPALVLGVALAGCAPGPVPPKFQAIRVVEGQPYPINVAKIDIVINYVPPAGGPPNHIEAAMPYSPEMAVRQWVQDRLQPIGSANSVRVLVTDAEATETPLPIDNSLKGAFTTQQVARVDMKVHVSVQVLDDRQMVMAEATGDAFRSRSIPQGLTLNQHDQTEYDMLAEVIKALNDQVTPQLRASFGRWMAVPGGN